MQFDIDPLLGLKICLKIDRGFQLFLPSCQDASDISKVNFKYLDFSFDRDCIERGRFHCNPPPLLLDLFSISDTDTHRGDGDRPTKSRRKNALTGILVKEDEEGKPIPNQNPINKWILKGSEDYKNVFPQSMWDDNQPPFCNGADKQCCPR